jgi:NitT/TauT family transport system permease protein
MMSWAGGWFFLMAAEIFTVGQRDFRLPGLGAYLQEAANQGDTRAILWGIGALVLVIVALDQLVWRPLLAWADRFKLEMVEGENPPSSWFYDLLRSAHILERLSEGVWRPFSEWLDARFTRRPAAGLEAERRGRPWPLYLLALLLGLGLAYGGFRATLMLVTVPGSQWGEIGLGVLATLLRVSASPVIARRFSPPASGGCRCSAGSSLC